ncbi:hypothetical protein ILUMI_19841 [Ignelater luminosus]|uniref:Mutator-like transposase domain-containing protein n=1 Tax=Ignelater luminosus TaxID=2038154 RepID=A0A8K0G5G3_IGNLU|nr:hypothetical protein ILUMI_19841 [Ignelater luminosus]
MQHDIDKEVVQPQENKIKEHRIVDLQHVLTWATQLQLNRSKKCTAGTLKPIQEQRNGLISEVTFKCNCCGFEIRKSTYPQNAVENEKINVAAVWGTISTKSTYSNLKERLAIVDIIPMPYPVFKRMKAPLSQQWKENFWISTEKGSKEKHDLALKKGQVDKDGYAWIVIYTDCGWSDRSYDHSYNASSGVVSCNIIQCCISHPMSFLLIYRL